MQIFPNIMAANYGCFGLSLILMIYWGTQGNKNQQNERLDEAPNTPAGKWLKHL